MTRQHRGRYGSLTHRPCHGQAPDAGADHAEHGAWIGGEGERQLPLAVPFSDSFTVASTPRLRPLVTALGEAPRAAVLFVDSESARLVAVTEGGPGDEITLEAADVIGQHRRGGWLLLLQSRYQRHIHVHRARHFDAVAAALTDLVDHDGLQAIVLAGEPRNLAVFRAHGPPRLSGRIAGEVAAARHRMAGGLAATLDTVLIDAEGGGRAAAGADATIDAVNRGAVDRLYLLQSYEEEGRACPACQALQGTAGGVCRWCGAATGVIELGEGMVQRVLAASGDVASVDTHPGLERAGGVAALLRYPPR